MLHLSLVRNLQRQRFLSLSLNQPACLWTPCTGRNREKDPGRHCWRRENGKSHATLKARFGCNYFGQQFYLRWQGYVAPEVAQSTQRTQVVSRRPGTWSYSSPRCCCSLSSWRTGGQWRWCKRNRTRSAHWWTRRWYPWTWSHPCEESSRPGSWAIGRNPRWCCWGPGWSERSLAALLLRKASPTPRTTLWHWRPHFGRALYRPAGRFWSNGRGWSGPLK